MGRQEGAMLVVDRRGDKSLLMSLLQAAIKPLRPRLVQAKSKDDPGAESRRLSPPPKLARDHDVNERLVDDIWVYDVTNKNAQPPPLHQSPAGDGASPARCIYYFAGGGWQTPPTPFHWALAAELASRLLGTTVSVVSYPLAPRCPASVSMSWLKTLYRTVLDQAARDGERVVLAGDSSGANVALSLVLWDVADAATSRRAQPVAVMAISPSTDLRHPDLGVQATAPQDPILTPSFVSSTSEAWCGSRYREGDRDAPWTAGDARVSPILAPIERAVEQGIRIHGIVGTFDVLAPEAMIFMERCRDAGVQGRWLVWEGQMHCFPLVFRYGLKEGVEAVNWMVDVLSKD